MESRLFLPVFLEWKEKSVSEKCLKVTDRYHGKELVRAGNRSERKKGVIKIWQIKKTFTDKERFKSCLLFLKRVESVLRREKTLSVSQNVLHNKDEPITGLQGFFLGKHF